MTHVRSALGPLLVLLWITPLSAQSPGGTVRGRVTDGTTQQPLAGVTITIGPRGTLTENDGAYVISGVPAGADTVRARMLGYAPATQAVTITDGGSATADFALNQRAISLSQVVVVGYGHQRAGDIAGAVKQVNTGEFNTGTVISPQMLIQSKVAGVQVVDNNEPGGGISIRIRGATSVNASSEPLYVIDGMPVSAGSGGGLSAGRDPLNFLNPEDIESITVLKDASAAAIYGANAANGVVLIKTKSGSGGPHIQYSGSVAASSVTRLPQVLNATQFRNAVQQYAPGSVGQLGDANTNWFDLVDRTGWGQEHNVVISGAGQSNDYRIAVGYLNQDGIIRGTNTQRVSLGVNYNQRLLKDRLEVHTNLKGSRSLDAFAPGGVLSNAVQMGPTQPVFDPTSTTGFYEWPGNSIQSADNPVAIMNLASSGGRTYRSVGNAQAQYHLPFIEGLSANVNLGYDATSVSQETFTPSVLHSETKSGEKGYDYRQDPSQLNTVLDTYLDYDAPLHVAPGQINVTAGYSYSKSHAEYPSYTATNLSTDLLKTNGFSTAQNVSNFLDVENSLLISFFGRLNYNLNDRYLVAASVRRDGSSRFGPANAWGVFPSVAVAWRISQEPFLRDISALSDLKLRASWAKTGNQAFANYQQYSAFLVGNSQAQVQFGNQFVNTIRPSAVDPDIKWEATRSWNVGLDYGFLNQRFSGSIDWYRKNTSDLIFTVPIAAGTNFSNFLTTNIGSMKNDGVEFSLSARVLDAGKNRLGWTADVNASHNTNELTSINPFAGSAQQILTGLVSGGVGTFIQVLEPGQPINSFFVYQQQYANGKPTEGSYADLNGDGITNVADRRAFHDPAPKWIFGQSSYFSYNKFDLSYTLRAYLGNYVYNNVASNLGSYQELQRGSPYNLSTSVLQTGFTTPQYLSDYYVEKAAFLRLDNVTLGYGFKYDNQPMRLSLTMQNAFTLTGYDGVDPTAGLNGLDNNIYPRSRTVTLGLSVQF
ncbi:MAG TPA: SusC/RagA family TonB-linked outer membrane protein [Gemmatimonadaceae bacterium]|nr:SusC/RagA family TonB-linked outer membrane protein [Gemmatimonadaceae bacterium]